MLKGSLMKLSLSLVLLGLASTMPAAQAKPDFCWQDEKSFLQLRWVPQGKELLVVADSAPCSLRIYKGPESSRALIYQESSIAGTWRYLRVFDQTDEFLVLATAQGKGCNYEILFVEDGKIDKAFEGRSERELEFHFSAKNEHEIWTYYSDSHGKHRRKYGWTGDEFREFADDTLRKFP